MEEAQELRSAETPEDVLLELADLLEVVRSLSSATGVNWEEVIAAADKKRAKRGSFSQEVVLLETSWPSKDAPEEGGGREIPLRSLARTSPIEGGCEISYASLYAAGAEPVFHTSSGHTLKLSLTSSGVRVEEVADHRQRSQLQFDF